MDLVQTDAERPRSSSVRIRRKQTNFPQYEQTKEFGGNFGNWGNILEKSLVKLGQQYFWTISVLKRITRNNISNDVNISRRFTVLHQVIIFLYLFDRGSKAIFCTDHKWEVSHFAKRTQVTWLSPVETSIQSNPMKGITFCSLVGPLKTQWKSNPNPMETIDPVQGKL